MHYAGAMRQRCRSLLPPVDLFVVLVVVLLLAPAVSGCTRAAGVFSEQNAGAHVALLAGTIGTRPVGSEANARARAYVVDQLKLYGYEVRVQETDARRAPLGVTAHVSNIIGVLPGSRPDAIGLVSHYDSVAESPGAADDGLGVAVMLEAARVLAGRPDRTWTIMVLVTDGEEAGLMGAAALVTDRAVTERLRAYINVESSGSSGPALLFETGPGNAWLVGPWARRAPHPRGGSFGLEIYRRLPNDTDFSILKRQEIPGLNFAVVGDSYTYHTARDTPERLSPRTVRDTGDNVVAIATALDAVDITQRSASDTNYFDIGGVTAVSYSGATAWIIAAAALLLGVIAWVKVTAASLRLGGALRWVLTSLWSAIGMAIVVAGMVGATWTLRSAREVYHPWYAHPDRLLCLLLAVGVTLGWTMSRVGAWLPARAHGVRHPAFTWSLALPLWIALSVAGLWLAPAAAYLWTVPLVAAGLLLTVAPAANVAGLRAASVVILAVAATLWLRDTVELSRFIVAVFGRLTLITPIYVYAALVALAGVMIAPPFIAAAASPRPVLRPSLVTALCLLAVVVTGVLAYRAPGYTYEQPLRRHVRALQEAGATGAIWEVGSVEPGLDLAAGAPGGWTRQTTAIRASVPWGRLTHPFVFRTTGPSLGPAPIDIAGFTIAPVEAGVELTVTVVPKRPGLTVSFVLPGTLVPARSNLPGVVFSRWIATFVAPPAEGIVWRASFPAAAAAQLRDVRVTVTDEGFPGGGGWQRLPAWLPQDRAVWNGTATWAVPASVVRLPVEPVAPLR